MTSTLMRVEALQNLKHNIDDTAYIARELEARLLEHLPRRILCENKLDLLRDCTAPLLMEGKFAYNDAEFNCIIAHLIPLWQKDLAIFLQEIWRILSSEGTFLFCTLGQWQAHELETLGDLLVKIGFDLPVVDQESLQLHYDDMDMLTRDLELSGLTHENVKIFSENPQDIIVEMEVIYAYTSGKLTRTLPSANIEIPVTHITKRK